MEEIRVIAQRELFGKDFKIYGDFENPLFLAKDVAEWIDYSKSGNGSYNVSQMLSTIDDDEKLNSTLLVAGQKREVTFLTEDGLYEIIMQSRKPNAKQVKAKIKEILKDVRRRGIYATDTTIDNILCNPNFGIKLLTALKTEREQKLALERQIEANKPKTLFADAVTASKTSILVGELAKILKQNGIGIGQNRLFEWLRKNGYLISRSGTDYNMPTQYSMELGLFEIKETVITHGDGHTSINKTPKVTGKGQIYFVNKLKVLFN